MRVYRLAAAAFLVVACQDDPSGIPRENLAQHVNEPVFSINPSVVDSVVSVFVKYEPGLRAEERVHAAMRAGARLAADIERRGVLVTELPRDSVARIAGLWWVRSVEVGKDDLRPTGWFGLSSLVEAMEPLAEQLPWGVARIDADDVHALGYRGTGATIGIIDDGYNCGHQDIVSHHGFGLYDFVLMEPYGWENWCTLGFHGSGVVGIAAASRDNGVAVIGVSPEATVYLLRVCSDLLGCTEARIALALDMAASRDLDVVNISLGNCGQNISGGLSDALDDAYEQGVTIVVSGGNGIYSDPPCSPGSPVSGLARHAATIGVSAINQDGLYDRLPVRTGDRVGCATEYSEHSLQ